METFLFSKFRSVSKKQRTCVNSSSLPPRFAYNIVKNLDGTWNYTMSAENNRECFEAAFQDTTIKKTEDEWWGTMEGLSEKTLSFQEFIWGLPRDTLVIPLLKDFRPESMPPTKTTQAAVRSSTINSVVAVDPGLSDLEYKFDKNPEEYFKSCVQSVNNSSSDRLQQRKKKVLLLDEIKERYVRATKENQLEESKCEALLRENKERMKHSEDLQEKIRHKKLVLARLGDTCSKYFRECMDLI